MLLISFLYILDTQNTSIRYPIPCIQIMCNRSISFNNLRIYLVMSCCITLELHKNRWRYLKDVDAYIIFDQSI